MLKTYLAAGGGSRVQGRIVYSNKLSFIPLFWSSASFVENLREACLGFPSHVKLRQHGAHAIAALHKHVNAAVAIGKSLKKGAQSAMRAAIQTYMYSGSLSSTLSRRLCNICTMPSHWNPAAHDWDKVRSRLKDSMTPFGVFCTLKVWLNAWPTSHRLRLARRLPCIFGCNNDDERCGDNVSHYLICPALHAALTELLAELQLFPIILLGLSDAPIKAGVADSAEHPYPDVFVIPIALTIMYNTIINTSLGHFFCFALAIVMGYVLSLPVFSVPHCVRLGCT